MHDQYNLQRFVTAQEPVYRRVREELRRGRKTSHWMWFIFPQLSALGRSPTAKIYGISSLDEARAYSAHPLLGERLRECTVLVCSAPDASIKRILGYPDYLKFRSSMTLFANATDDNQVFIGALERFYKGEPDPATLELIQF